MRGPGLRCHIREWVKHHHRHPFTCLFVGDRLSLTASCVPATVLGSRDPRVSPDSAIGCGGSDCVFGTNETLYCLGFDCIQESP